MSPAPLHAYDLPHVPRDPAIDEEWKAAEEAHELARRKYAVRCDLHKSCHPRLIYAAGARCICGAGLAYLNTSGIHGAWDCSAVLKGEAAQGVEHSERLPFAMYEVKSELQPSADGRTTRPPESKREAP